MRVFLDTEFTNLSSALRDLISIGLVSESGHEFYAELSDFNPANQTDFVKQVVLPKLGRFPDRVMTRTQAGDELMQWLLAIKREEKWIEICYDFIGDWYLMRELLNAVPEWMTYTNFLSSKDASKQEQYFINAAANGEPDEVHHALYDARALRFACS